MGRVVCFFSTLVLVITSLLGAQAFGSECLDRDLRGSSLGSPRDQGNSGWCFAYVAADLMSFELNQRISASDLAIEYLADYKGPAVEFSRWITGESDEGAGSEIGAITSIRDRGLCLESKMSSSPQAFLEYLLLRGRDLKEQPFAQEFLKRCSNSCKSCQFSSALFVGEKFCDILAAGVMAGVPFSNKDFDQYRERVCKDRIPVPKNLKLGKMWARDSSLTDAIRSKIRQGKPVAIDYKSIISGDGKIWHSSTVVATRPRNGSCEYLVRLTRGSSCAAVHKKFECDKSDPGNAWIKEEDLVPVLRSITYVSGARL